MYKNITPDYYGYRDDDDGVLMEKEAKREVRQTMIRYTCLNCIIRDLLSYIRSLIDVLPERINRDRREGVYEEKEGSTEHYQE